MPHNPNKVVNRVSFHKDFSNYWYNCIVSHEGMPFKIVKANPKDPDREPQDYCDLIAVGKVLTKDGWKGLTIEADKLCYEFPRLGFVHTDTGWYYLYRQPHRKMVKGYHAITVSSFQVDDRQNVGRLDVFRDSVLRQIFNGNPNRISVDCIIDDRKRVFYEVEHVANIKDDGTIEVIENHEKMGAYICKLLANSSAATSMVPNLRVTS